MKIINSLKDNVRSICFMLPAFIMTILPWSIEEKFNILIFDYDFSIFLFLGYVLLIFKNKKQKETFVIFTLFFVFISALLCSGNYILGRYFVGIEFILGYIFAREIEYNEDICNIIGLGSIFLLLAVLFQQISLSLGLGFIESGQQTVELTDGILRVGTSVGSSTLTGILVVIFLGIILQTSKNVFIDYIFFFLGAVSVVLSGTRSAILVLFLMGIVMLFFDEKYKISKFVKFLFFIVLFIYVMPFLTAVFESRNLVAGENSDITSGRIERWVQAFKVFNESSLNYLFGVGPATVPISMFNIHIKSIASPHNVYMGLLLEFGLLYTIAYLIFVIRKMKKCFSFYSLSSIVLVGSMLVSWNTEVVPLNFLYSFFFWLLYFLNTYKVSEEYENCIY